ENSEQSLVFEVNKANVINHGLTIDPEILLMGGTEIDIARLYRSSQQSMDSMQRQMQQIADSIFRLNETITQSREQIDRQQDRILEQKSMLAEQNTKIENGLKEIEAHEQEIASHKKEILRQLKELNMQRMSLKEQELEITEQESYNQQQQNDIRESKKILDSLWLEIDQKNIELVEQGELIRRQKQISLLTTLAGFLSIVALLSLIYGFRSKAKKNKILTQQKKKMEQINARLNATNKSLYDTIRRLSEAQSQLVASEKMASLGVLTAGIAHEINNPVNFIYTGINSLNNDMNDLRIFIEEVDELLKNSGINELIDRVEALKTERDFDEIMEIIPQTIDDIRIGAERAADIIKGLRNFSRIDKDALQYYNIHEGIDSSLLLLRNKFKNHIEIVKDYRQLPQIECYPGKLNQVFMNLLSNAIDAIDKKGTITIRTRLEGEDRITIEVEDTGEGIHPENLGKIFDPFFTTKSVGKGVGLGLSISFGIIKDHDGTIDVKSDRNKGSIFTISLPCNINRDKKP
ncbi:MAG TPA: ATP-binding protein, partial [Prolixibacteraceae bacterium]|nr:ATP-binding protein [Prolixibacteraceae bacterium]